MDRGFAYGYADVRYAVSSESDATDTFVKSKGWVKQAATRRRGGVSQRVGSGGHHLLEAATPVSELLVSCHEQRTTNSPPSLHMIISRDSGMVFRNAHQNGYVDMLRPVF